MNVDSKNHYKTYCQVLSEVIKTSKNLYYNNLIAQADNKQKVTWNVINTRTQRPQITWTHQTLMVTPSLA